VTRSVIHVGVGVLILAVVVGGALPVLAAATTEVGLTPSNPSIDAGGNQTFDIIVMNVDAGVGAYNITVSVQDDPVADVTGVIAAGQPYDATRDYANDNSSVTLTVFGLDTADNGSVTVGTVNVTGETDGATEVRLAVSALGDESGSSYTVSDTHGATITVGGGDDQPPTSTTTTATTTSTSTDTTTTQEPTTTSTSPTSTTTDTTSTSTMTITTDTTNPSTTSSTSTSPSGIDDGETTARTTDTVGPGFGILSVALLVLGVALLVRETQ